MAGVTRQDQFRNDVRYAVNPAGCAVCGSNVGPAIDLGVSVHMEGPLALCESHARDCGLFAGLRPTEEVNVLHATAAEELLIAGEALDRATAERKEAAAALALIEKIVGAIKGEPDRTPKVKS